MQAPPPPESRRRGFQAPAKRGISFEPFTKEEQDRIAAEAKAGKLPSADVEVFFDYDMAEVTRAAQKTLAPLVKPSRSQARLQPLRPDWPYRCQGRGGHNQALSERRAAAVKDYLAGHSQSRRNASYPTGAASHFSRMKATPWRRRTVACRWSITAWWPAQTDHFRWQHKTCSSRADNDIGGK